MHTPSSIVIDASALHELLHGTSKGERIRKLLGTSQMFITPLCISELISRAQRDGTDAERALRAILDTCIVVETRGELAYDAGMFHAMMRKKKPKFSHGDASVIAASHALKAKILTCDNDFQGVKDAVIIR